MVRNDIKKLKWFWDVDNQPTTPATMPVQNIQNQQQPESIDYNHHRREEDFDAPESPRNRVSRVFGPAGSKYDARRIKKNKRLVAATIVVAIKAEEVPTQEPEIKHICKAKTRAQRRALDPEPEEAPIRPAKKKERRSNYWVRHGDVGRTSERAAKIQRMWRIVDDESACSE